MTRLFFISTIIFMSGCSTLDSREARHKKYFDCVRHAQFDPKTTMCESVPWFF